MARGSSTIDEGPEADENRRGEGQTEADEEEKGQRRAGHGTL